MALEKKRRPSVAFLLSILTPGLGHLYSGKHIKAIGIYVGFCSLFSIAVGAGLLNFFWGLVVLLLVSASAFIYVAISAAITAKNEGVARLRPYNRWYVYVSILLFSDLVVGSFVQSIAPVKTYATPSGAMEPAIMAGDRIFVEKDYYRKHRPVRGEVVIYVREGEGGAFAAVARVIGLPAETISIRSKTVRIDGVVLEETWPVFRDQKTFPDEDVSGGLRFRDHLEPLVIPSDSVFLLGDNRDYSYDSRFLGPVRVDQLLHRSLYVYWSRHIERVGDNLRDPR